MALRALLALALAAVCRGAADSPIAKVVDLIEEMKSKVMEDGKAEQKVYDKFACWCEKTLARKADQIEDAKAEIETLDGKVLTQKGATGTLVAEVRGLQADVKSNEDSAAESATLRAKETKDYDEERDDLEQAIGALERAITILTGAGEKTASALQEEQVMQAAAGLMPVLQLANGGRVGTVSEKDRHAIEAFVAHPAETLSQHVAMSGLQQKGPTGDYAAQSTQIQGILKGMYDAFTGELESKNVHQANKQKDYEKLSSTMSAELEALQATLGNRKFLWAAADKILADATQDRDETKKQLAEDEKFFDDAKAECRQRADVWAERSRLRTEELNGIEKALQVLTSDEAKATFASSGKFLLQTSARDPAQARAFATLKSLARKQQSLRLATIAAKVHAASKGSFDMVITELDKMLAELRAEEQADIDSRDWCQTEDNKVDNDIDDLEHEIKETDGKIERLQEKVKNLEDAISQAEDDIQETKDAMAEALKQRNVENEDFKGALKDDQDAAALITTAINSLSSFYKNNKLPMGLLQTRKQPEDAIPQDTMSEPYGGRSSEGGGIVEILGYIKEDITKEIKTAKMAEAKALAEFEKQRNSAMEALEAIGAKKTSMEIQASETEELIADARESKAGTEATKGLRETYKEEIKPKCEWIKGAFETRRDKRQEEMKGLLKAKNDLAGGGAHLIQVGALRR